MNIARLSWINLVSNKLNTLLSILLMTFGVGIISLLLLINNGIEQQLQRNLKDIDMVIGAKGSPLQLILSTVYHVDNPTGNIQLKAANKFKKHPLVASTIPLSFGDSYKGYRIVGTTEAYLQLYQAEVRTGHTWKTPMEVVLGSQVAKVNQLSVGDTFHGSHGLVEGGDVHDDHSYVVVGILEASFSVLDELIITSSESVWNVHDHDESKHEQAHEHDHHHDHEHEKSADAIPEDAMITALLVKFRNPIGLIQIPRAVNETTNMQAAVPAYEISRLTSLLGVGVQTINVIALIIIIVSGLSIFIGLYNALNKRKKELALIRVHGASRSQLVQLVLLEGLYITIIGVVVGLLISRIALWTVNLMFESTVSAGLLHLGMLQDEVLLIGVALFTGLLASLIPTIQTYRIDIVQTLSSE